MAGLTVVGRPVTDGRPMLDSVVRSALSRGLKHALPHALMLAVMLWTMLGAHAPLRCIAGALVLVVSSIGYAPGARRRASHWEHIADLWAMALMLLACLGGPGAAGAVGTHAHLPLLAHGVAAAGIGVAWLVLRAAQVAARRRGRRAALAGSVLTAAGLVAMGLVG